MKYFLLLKNSVKFSFNVSMKNSRIFDNTSDSFPSGRTWYNFQCNHHHHHHHHHNYYPLRTITVSSRDPDYVTPAIKAKLRRKNRIMRVGRLDEADALAKQISKDISKSTKSQLSHILVVKTSCSCWWYYCPVPEWSLCCHIHWLTVLHPCV